MPERDRYRKKAQACVQLAEDMTDLGERVKMLQVAQAYMKLADHVRSRHDRATAHRDRGEQHHRKDS
jgi:hypothetical protein